MRITLESDYALRILTVLAESGDVIGAAEIAERTSVTPRFALKILHKLTGSGMVVSTKGAKGGYKLSVPPEEITLRRVIEWIDGPIIIARCLENSETCSMNTDKTACAYHHIFNSLSLSVAKKLEGITIADVLSKNEIF